MKIIRKIALPRARCKHRGSSTRSVHWARASIPLVVAPLVINSQQLRAEDFFGASGVLNNTNYKIPMPGAAPAFNWQRQSTGRPVETTSDTRSEMLFKLSLNSGTELAGDGSEPAWSGGLSMERIDFIQPDEIKMQDISQGFAYSASLDIEKTNDAVDQSPIVSSRQLGVHYGRLGSVNYSGVDLGFRQFSDNDQLHESNDQDLWSLGVTTGRRFALTGLEESDPLWTVSLRGQFSLIENSDDKVKLDNHLWYLSPGLYWQHDSFELSADVLMPFINSGEAETETDYRIRAKIQKRF